MGSYGRLLVWKVQIAAEEHGEIPQLSPQVEAPMGALIPPIAGTFVQESKGRSRSFVSVGLRKEIAAQPGIGDGLLAPVTDDGRAGEVIVELNHDGHEYILQ